MREKVVPIEALNYVIWDRDMADSHRGARGASPAVTISVSNGRICFNRAAVSVIGITSSVGLEFIQTGRNMNEWYVALSSRENAIKVSLTKSGACFCSVRLASSIEECVQRDRSVPSFRVQLGTKPTSFADRRNDEGGVVNAYALITLNVQDIATKKGGLS